jgi:hypothetical protein
VSGDATDSVLGRVLSTLRLGSAETLHVARRKVGRKVRRPVRRVWKQVAPRLARMGSSRNVAIVRFYAVHDGHTLNLQALLPADDTAVEPGRPPATELLFRHSQTRAEHRVGTELRRQDDGRWCAEATVVLGARSGAVPLTRGTWHVSLLTTGTDNAPRPLTLRRLQLPEPASGPTLSAPPCPDTGTQFRATTSAFGSCQLTVRPGRPRAEVMRCIVDLKQVTVLGRFIGVSETSGAVAEFSRRDDETTYVAQPLIDGDHFRIEAPLDALLPDAGGKDVWDIRLRFPNRPHLRVGRFVHDLSNLRGVIRTPERRVVTADLIAFHIRPSYTPAGRLALACTRSEAGVTQ